MKYFTSYILESIAYFIYFLAFLLWSAKDKRGVIKILSGYYFLCFIIILKANLVRGTSASNLYLYSILCILSSFALSAYFYNILRGSYPKILLVLLCIVNGVYYLLTNFVQEGPVVFDSMAFVLLSTSMVILSFIYIYQLLQDVKEEPLSLSVDFWFTASQLIYFIPTFTIFLTYGYLTRKAMAGDGYAGKSSALTWLWSIHNVLLFLSALLITGGITWISYQKRSR